MAKRIKAVRTIRRSCVTGEPVWVYQGTTHEGERQAYWKACKREQELIHHWASKMERFCANISSLLQACMAALPKTATLTEEQRSAVSKLKAMAENIPKPYTGFYNHIKAEHERRQADREIRRKMREREKQKNPCYDKQKNKGQ